MPIDPEFARMLDAAGYRWLSAADVWVNQTAGRAISAETIRRHTREWLVRWIELAVGDE